MTEPEVKAADAILRRNEVQYVVVGGQAIGKAIRATGDVDVMVTATDYAAAVAALQSDEDTEFQWEDQGVARFAMRPMGGEFLDVLDASEFAGSRGSEEFFVFLVEEESTERDGIEVRDAGRCLVHPPDGATVAALLRQNPSRSSGWSRGWSDAAGRGDCPTVRNGGEDSRAGRIRPC